LIEAKSPKNNGLGAIRTPDHRRVKSHCTLGSEALASNPRCFLSHEQGSFSNNGPHNGLSELDLPFTLKELRSYVEFRETGLTKKSQDWVERAARGFWRHTKGIINKNSLDALRSDTLERYKSEDSKSKMLSFAVAFLKYLTKTRLDNRYHAFSIFLERPKTLKQRKRVTNRIITKHDIENILTHIKTAESEGRLNTYRAQQYAAFILFGAYTGQRSNATVSKLTVKQFREALQLEKPVIRVKASQDKIRMEHYVPLHSQVVEALKLLLDGRADDKLMFEYNSFAMWIKRESIPLSRVSGHFVFGDLRKFAEQYGDVIGWNESNRSYVLTHGVSGVQWSNYRNPLPEYVYDVYMKYWGDTRFAIS
jgi:integrase